MSQLSANYKSLECIKKISNLEMRDPPVKSNVKVDTLSPRDSDGQQYVTLEALKCNLLGLPTLHTVGGAACYELG